MRVRTPGPMQGLCAGPMCRANVQVQCAGPMCRAYAGPMCRAYVQGQSAGPMCRSNVQGLCAGPMQGQCAGPMCRANVQGLCRANVQGLCEGPMQGQCAGPMCKAYAGPMLGWGQRVHCGSWIGACAGPVLYYAGLGPVRVCQSLSWKGNKGKPCTPAVGHSLHR